MCWWPAWLTTLALRNPGWTSAGGVLWSVRPCGRRAGLVRPCVRALHQGCLMVVSPGGSTARKAVWG